MRGPLLAVAGLGLVVSAIWLPLAPVIGFWSLVVIVGLLVERYRYKPVEASGPGAGWVRTDERFLDPESGEPVVVFYEPGTGERRYVQDQRRPGDPVPPDRQAAPPGRQPG